MKLTTLLLIVGILQVSATSLAQKVVLNEKNAPLAEVFENIRQQTGYDFIFTKSILNQAKPITLQFSGELGDALKKIFNDEPFEYQVSDRSVLIKTKAKAEPSFLDKIKQAIAAIDVTGRITDENGQPLSGATITEKGTSNATNTDANGFFTLKNTQPNATIIVSYIGYDKKELLASVNVGNIKLSAATNPLDEIQIIAYGQTSQRLSVSNIAKVKGDDIQNQPVNNILQSIEGRVAGLFITPSSGLPGTAMTVRVQGVNSLGNGNNPLYVIDGMPYVSEFLPTTKVGNLGVSTSSAGTGNPMSLIDPTSIESIEVLKDADATSIYGSRAANGAILITTKKGKAGKQKISVNLQNGWGQVVNTLPLMNTQQYLQMRHEALKNDGIAKPSTTDYDINGTWDTTRNTNWQKTLIGNIAHYFTVNESISGGNSGVQYFVGGTYNRQTSVFPGNFSDVKGGLHFSLNTESPNQRFRMSLTGSYLIDDNNLPTTDLTSTALILPPDAPALYNPDGSLNWQTNSSGAATWSNPLLYTLRPYQRKGNNLISSMNLSYNILQGLEVKINLGYNNLRVNEFNATPLSSYDSATQLSLGTNGRVSNFSNSTISSWIVEPQLNYRSKISKGMLDILVGSTIQQNHSDGITLGAGGFSSDALLNDIKSATNITVGSTTNATYKYNALFSRLNYIWDDKYIVNLSARRDGSSRFGPQSQFHNFISAGLGWVFSEERLFKNDLSALSFGKIRASYGTTGNDQIADYAYMNLYKSVTASVPYQAATSLAATGLPNPYLQWETTKKLQIGLDLGFFQNRILITGNYVYNRSSNELISSPLPIITGFSTISQNVPATIQNTAIELTVNTVNVKSKKIRWSSSLNLTIPKNKLVSYFGTVPANLIVGEPVNITKALKFAGVNSTTGAYQFISANGSLTSNPDLVNDRTGLINTVFPKYYGGLQNDFYYKNFQLSFLVQFTNKIAPSYRFGASAPGNPRTNEPNYVLDRWQSPGDIKSVQRYNSNFSLSTQFLYATLSDAYYSNAGYARLKNASISYKLNDNILKRLYIEGLTFYAEGQNILTFTKFKGLDPETGNLGLPPLRMLTLGIRADL